MLSLRKPLHNLRNYTEMMNQLLMTFLSILALAGCSSNESETGKSQNEAKEAAVEQTTPKGGFPASYVNGINDKNAGDKKGPIRVFGTTRNAPQGSMMYLFETEGKSQEAIDSTKIVDGKWDFGVKNYSRGFYMANFNNDLNNMMPVILNPDESEVELTFNSVRLNANNSAASGTENGAWFPYRAAETQMNAQIRNLRGQMKDAAFKERVEKQITDKERELRDLQKQVMEENQGTFVAKYLTWKFSAFPNDKGRYWDDIDFNDLSLIRTPIMPDRVQEFMRTHSGGEPSGFINCVDLLKARAEENPVMLEYVLYTMLDGFYQSGMEDIAMYILDNYIFDDDCGANLSDVVKQRAQGIVNLQIGKTPPNFKVQTSDGRMLDFMAEVKKNEYTLLMFWASWCHKCEQEMPVLKRLFETYKGRGFGVVGFSVDGNRQQWLQAIQDKGAESWPNVSQLMSWDSPVSREYRVTQTPALFLLNRKGEIVDKPKRIFEVERFLQKKL